MDRTEAQRLSKEDIKSGVMSPANQPASKWQAVYIAGAGTRSVRTVELNRALAEYSLGHYEDAEIVLLNLMGSLKRILTRPSRVEGLELVQYSLLYAAAWAVMGRTRLRQGQSDEAQEAFRQAVALFDQWLPKAKEPAGQDYSEYGVALHMLGRKDEARDVLKKAVDFRSATPDAYLYLGIDLKEQRLYDEAEGLLRKAVELAQDNACTHKALAETLEAKGQIGEASGEYQQAALGMMAAKQEDEALVTLDHSLRLNPEDPKALAIKGQVLRALNRNEEAVQAFQRGIEIDPSLDWAYAELGETLRLLGRYEEALEALDHALALTTDEILALRTKAEVLRVLNRNEEAAQALQRCIEIDSSVDWAYAELGETLRLLGRYEEALEALNKALALKPDYPYALGTKGGTLYELGKYKEALEVLDRALALRPDYPFAWETKGGILHALFKYDDALAAFERALTKEPNRVSALRSKGYALLALRRNDDALRTFERAKEVNPADPWVLADFAWGCQLNDDYGRALEALDEALRVDSQNAWALTIKGSVLSDIADFRAAVDILDHANKINSSDATAFGLKGWALENLGVGCSEGEQKALYVRDAHKAYKTAFELEKENLWYLKGIGDALHLMGKHRDAKKTYSKVIELAEKSGGGDAGTLSLKGWCHYCLRQYDEAVRLFIEALSLDASLTFVQFDLALALMCSQRYGLSLREYKRGVEAIGKRHILRQRGLLHVAKADLGEATKAQPAFKKVKEVQESLELIEEAFNIAGARATAAS
jgi:tetratricopeptide (TPR) repeat protein